MADAPSANDELYPIAVLIDELKVRAGNPRARSGAPAFAMANPGHLAR